MKRLVAVAVLSLLYANAAFACPVCFGSPDDPMVQGVNKGIWVLLGFIAVVQIGFVALFWNFWRRAKANRQFRESFHIVRSGEGGSQS